jgi:hypothetical protein
MVGIKAANAGDPTANVAVDAGHMQLDLVFAAHKSTGSG